MACFVSGTQAEQLLMKEEPGTFLLRMSERLPGDFVVTYKQSETSIRHYLVQGTDTSDKKKTIVDFFGQKAATATGPVAN